MTPAGYTILAYVLGLGLILGYAVVLGIGHCFKGKA